MSTPRSGRQLTIAAHGYRAVVASVGASLRVLEFEGRDLVVPFDADEVRPGYRGVTLAPWPNRIVDGAYSFAGVEYQLPLTEPSRGHALHGLLAWAEFADRVVADDRVVLVAVIEPQSGYPFRVEVEVEYRLAEDGLTQTVTALNLGADAAPWGTGPHPYLVAPSTGSGTQEASSGDHEAGSGTQEASSGTQESGLLSLSKHPTKGRVDDWTLTLPASEVLTVTEDRLSPIAVEPVSQHPEWDFREPRVIGDVFIDHAFTALERTDGVAEVRLVDAEGTGVALSWDEGCPWVQIHTADVPADDAVHRIGLAVEPMTCPPDAFNTGVDLVVVEPGAAHAASWRFSAI